MHLLSLPVNILRDWQPFFDRMAMLLPGRSTVYERQLAKNDQRDELGVHLNLQCVIIVKPMIQRGGRSMFCPKCSTEKAHKGTQFCTKCGTDLSELEDYVRRGFSGTRPNGIKQGVKLILLGIILIPVWMFIGPMFPPDDRLVEGALSTTWLEQLFWILMWMSFLAGAARLIYAFAFELGAGSTDKKKQGSLGSSGRQRSLPNGEDFRPADAGRWRSTDELFDHVVARPRTSEELR